MINCLPYQWIEKLLISLVVLAVAETLKQVKTPQSVPDMENTQRSLGSVRDMLGIQTSQMVRNVPEIESYSSARNVLIPAKNSSGVQRHSYSSGSATVTQVCIVELSVGACTSYDEATGMRYEGFCPYHFKLNTYSMYYDGKSKHIIVNVSSCSHLNNATCGQLNREGLLCSKCKAGYGPALYSKTWMCEQCDDNFSYLMWIVYLLVEVTPLTVFFILVIIFNVQLTAPPFTAYVLYCQYFTVLFDTSSYFHTYLLNYVDPYVYKLVFSVLSVSSLDFFKYFFPPFCVSSKLTNIHVILLGLVPASYSVILVILTYVLIELHARNFCVVVNLWKPFSRCVAKVRRSYDPKASVFNAFSTFLLLSYSNVLFIGSQLMFRSEFFGCSIRDRCSNISRLYYYPHQPEGKYDVHYLIVFFIVFMFTLPPLVLLLLYPIRFFQRVLRFLCCQDLRCVQSFVDIFQGHYKDGTNGTRDYRFMAGFQFILRIMFYYTNKWYRADMKWIRYTDVGLVIMCLCYLCLLPCKKKYMNVIEGALYGLAIITSIMIDTLSYSKPHSTWHIGKVTLIFFLMLLPSIVLLTLFVHRVMMKIPVYRSFYRVLSKYVFHRKGASTPLTDSLPHRLISPSTYTPLL